MTQEETNRLKPGDLVKMVCPPRFLLVLWTFEEQVHFVRMKEAHRLFAHGISMEMHYKDGLLFFEAVRVA